MWEHMGACVWEHVGAAHKVQRGMMKEVLRAPVSRPGRFFWLPLPHQTELAPA